jgi:FkbM family methyltransferase
MRTTDISLCREIFVHRSYDQDFANDPRVIVDVGANIGLSSVFYATKYPQARILAVEPESSNYKVLLDNISPYPNITAMQAALWHENSEIPMFDPGTGNTTFRVWKNKTSGTEAPSQTVRALTMDGLLLELGSERVDLLKVDIEGAEKEVFGSGATAWTERVGLIAIEIHDWLREGCGEMVRRATKQFESEWMEGEVTYFAKPDFIRKNRGQKKANTPVSLKILATQ